MKPLGAILLAGLLSGCGANAPTMSAGDAAPLLEQFAAGAAPFNVCTGEGRATLRAAVRAYGDAMAQNGASWPRVDAVTRLDASVVTSLAAGFIEASDLRAPVRGQVNGLIAGSLREVVRFRDAARMACDEVAALQQAMARHVLEEQRQTLIDEDRQARNLARVRRSREALDQAVRAVELRMEEARGAGNAG